MVMTYSYAKVQGQQSVGSKDKMEANGRIDGRTEAIALPAALTKVIRISQLWDGNKMVPILLASLGVQQQI